MPASDQPGRHRDCSGRPGANRPAAASGRLRAHSSAIDLVHARIEQATTCVRAGAVACVFGHRQQGIHAQAPERRAESQPLGDRAGGAQAGERARAAAEHDGVQVRQAQPGCASRAWMAGIRRPMPARRPGPCAPVARARPRHRAARRRAGFRCWCRRQADSSESLSAQPAIIGEVRDNRRMSALRFLAFLCLRWPRCLSLAPSAATGSGRGAGARQAAARSREHAGGGRRRQVGAAAEPPGRRSGQSGLDRQAGHHLRGARPARARFHLGDAGLRRRAACATARCTAISTSRARATPSWWSSGCGCCCAACRAWASARSTGDIVLDRQRLRNGCARPRRLRRRAPAAVQRRPGCVAAQFQVGGHDFHAPRRRRRRSTWSRPLAGVQLPASRALDRAASAATGAAP